MKIITANIGRTGMTAARVREDLRKIKRQRGAKFIGFQEIDEADQANEHQILNSVFKRNPKVGMKHMDPIVGARGASVISRQIVKACDGIDGVTPTRWITAAVWQYRGKRFVHVNTHFPAFAFNGKDESFQDEVMAAWQEQFRKLSEVVKHFNDQGYTVFWTGDVNRVDMPKVHPKERQLVTAGIDSISVIEGEYKVRVRNKGHLSLNSDHDARWVQVDLVNK